MILQLVLPGKHPEAVLYPAAAYWDVYYRPDLVRQALRITGR